LRSAGAAAERKVLRDEHCYRLSGGSEPSGSWLLVHREPGRHQGHVRADLPVVFASGYTGDVVMRHGMLDEDVGFVDKPLTPHALAVSVRRVLDIARAKRQP
jgi:hypothetical protein